MKVWEKKIVGTMVIDDPEEKELANLFNDHVHHLLKVIPKADKREFFDMLETLNGLYTNAVNQHWNDGYLYGLNEGSQRGLMKGLTGVLKIMDHSITTLREEVTALIS